MTAGTSAGREALRARLNIAEFERLLAAERRRLHAYTAASESENRIAALLAAMAAWGWELLPDRRWPGSQNANVDMILVGPGGVLAVDVKAWAEPRIEHGLLYRGDADASDEVDKLLAITNLVEQVAGECGLVPTAVVPVVRGPRRRAVRRAARHHSGPLRRADGHQPRTGRGRPRRRARCRAA